jgi:hypothetical protein
VAGKTEKKLPLGRPVRRWEYNIKNWILKKLGVRMWT